jgi:hypothetical protein
MAWRYGVKPEDNDTSVTAWMVLALRSALASGAIRVDGKCLQGAETWIRRVTEPEWGKVGYTARGNGPARFEEHLETFPADKSEALTAAGILCRIILGEDPAKSPMVKKGAALCLRVLPEWDAAGGSVDMYYWYYGSLAMFQVGGEPWKRWHAALTAAVLPHQRREGHAAGSWDPVGPWGGEGGRIYSTALLTMCLQTPYRYGRFRGASPRPVHARAAGGLDRIVSLKLDSAQILDAFAHLNDQSDIPIVVSEEALALLGGGRVSIALEEVPLRTALDLLCAHAGAEWRVEDGKVVIRPAR